MSNNGDPGEDFYHVLNPPMVVSGRVEIVDDGEEPFGFENGLAVRFSCINDNECGPGYNYHVILVDGRIREVDDHSITSITPWTPNTVLPQPKTDQPDEVAAAAERVYSLLVDKPRTRPALAQSISASKRWLIPDAIRLLESQNRFAIDRDGIYWAMDKGQPQPAELAKNFKR